MPTALKPQHFATPAVVRTQACTAPAETEETFTACAAGAAMTSAPATKPIAVTMRVLCDPIGWVGGGGPRVGGVVAPYVPCPRVGGSRARRHWRSTMRMRVAWSHTLAAAS